MRGAHGGRSVGIEAGSKQVVARFASGAKLVC